MTKDHRDQIPECAMVERGMGRMIRQIDENEYRNLIRGILVGLFGTEDPDVFTFPFRQHFDRSLIVFEYPGFPAQALMQAIMRGSLGMNERGFYMTFPEPHPIGGTIAYHWLISYDALETYEERTPIDKLDYIFLSPQGSWCLVPSGELFAVLSGNWGIMDRVMKLLPFLEGGVVRALQHWKEVKTRHSIKTDIRWVRPLLFNVYGGAQAEALMKEAGWDPLEGM